MVGSTTDALYSLDLTTGIATRIGTATQFGVRESQPSDLAWDGSTLYMLGWDADALYSLDPTTGVATRIGSATAFGVSEILASGLALSLIHI